MGPQISEFQKASRRTAVSQFGHSYAHKRHLGQVWQHESKEIARCRDKSIQGHGKCGRGTIKHMMAVAHTHQDVEFQLALFLPGARCALQQLTDREVKFAQLMTDGQETPECRYFFALAGLLFLNSLALRCTAFTTHWRPKHARSTLSPLSETCLQPIKPSLSHTECRAECLFFLSSLHWPGGSAVARPVLCLFIVASALGYLALKHWLVRSSAHSPCRVSLCVRLC